MPYKADKFIKVYLTHSELFGVKKARSELERMINSVPLLGMFEALSVLSFSSSTDRATTQANFIEYIKSFGDNSGIEYDPQPLLIDRIICTNQGTLATWKWLLAFGDASKIGHRIEIQRGINLAILVQAAIADYLYEEENEDEKLIIFEIFQNSLFNTHDNIFSMLGRTKMIMSDIARDEALFNAGEYINFNSDFETHYGYTIEDYLIAISGLLSLFQSTSLSSTLTDINSVFSRTEFCDLITEIIEPLCFSFEEGKTWALTAMDNSWDFRLFSAKPFLRFNENLIIPVSLQYLGDQLFSSLYWKIRRCYPGHDSNFIRFFGRPFEIYLQNLLNDASNSSNLRYEFIPEFSYNNGQSKSPDAMLKLGNKLLVIEGKAKGVTEPSAIYGDPKTIETDFNRLVCEPYNQVINRLIEIRNDTTPPDDLLGVNEFYIIVVNQNDFPHLPTFEDRVRATMLEEKRVKIKYYCHFDIEEFEQLCYLIGRSAKKPIFRILDNHYRDYPNVNFKNFLFTAHHPVKRPKKTKRAAQEFIECGLRRLFQQNKE